MESGGDRSPEGPEINQQGPRDGSSECGQINLNLQLAIQNHQLEEPVEETDLSIDEIEKIEEAERLVKAAEDHGIRSWTQLKRIAFPNNIIKSSQVQDKWRILLKTAHRNPKDRRGICRKYPKQLLERVLAVAQANSKDKLLCTVEKIIASMNKHNIEQTKDKLVTVLTDNAIALEEILERILTRAARFPTHHFVLAQGIKALTTKYPTLQELLALKTLWFEQDKRRLPLLAELMIMNIVHEEKIIQIIGNWVAKCEDESSVVEYLCGFYNMVKQYLSQTMIGDAFTVLVENVLQFTGGSWVAKVPHGVIADNEPSSEQAITTSNGAPLRPGGTPITADNIPLEQKKDERLTAVDKIIEVINDENIDKPITDFLKIVESRGITLREILERIVTSASPNPRKHFALAVVIQALTEKDSDHKKMVNSRWFEHDRRLLSLLGELMVLGIVSPDAAYQVMDKWVFKCKTERALVDDLCNFYNLVKQKLEMIEKGRSFKDLVKNVMHYTDGSWVPKEPAGVTDINEPSTEQPLRRGGKRHMTGDENVQTGASSVDKRPDKKRKKAGDKTPLDPGGNPRMAASKYVQKDETPIKEKTPGLGKFHLAVVEKHSSVNTGSHIVVLRFMPKTQEVAADNVWLAELQTDVEDQCAAFGSFDLVEVRSNQPRAMVMVHFNEMRDAEECVKKMNGSSYEGRQILANIA